MHADGAACAREASARAGDAPESPHKGTRSCATPHSPCPDDHAPCVSCGGRYAIVGPRRRDMIHPFFNAQFGIVQLILNQLCPHGGVKAPAARRKSRRR